MTRTSKTKTKARARRKAAGGRPTRYRREFAEQARKLCLLGATDRDLAAFFGVEERTVNRWKTAHPEFCQSIRAGKDLADAEVADRLYQRAMGYSHGAVKIFGDPKTGESMEVEYEKHYPPDATAARFWLTNRQPERWRNKQDVEVAPSDALTDLLQAIDGRTKSIVPGEPGAESG